MVSKTIRILWTEDDNASVTIKGANGVASPNFTVNGSAVTFPYTLNASTSFVTKIADTYTVSVSYFGQEIANTPDGVRVVDLTQDAELVFAPSPDEANRSGSAAAPADLVRSVVSNDIPTSGTSIKVALDAAYVAHVGGLTVDGTGDNSTKIQPVLDAASSAGGGEVRLPRGVIRATLTLPPKVVLTGEGVGLTTLMAVAGSNKPAVKGKDFDTLTGKVYAAGDIQLGCHEAGLRNLTVDGDKASQTAGWAAQLWGRSLVLERVQVQNGHDGGLWTEFTTHDSGTNNDLLEAFMVNIKTANNGGDGWRFRGPHDSVIDNYVTVSNTGWGFKSETAPNSYRASLIGRGWNSWLNTVGSFSFGDNFRVSQSVASAGNVGIGVNIASTVTGNCFYQGLISGHVTGMVIRGTQHTFDVQANSISGTLFQLGEANVASCGYCLIQFTGTGIGTCFDRQNIASPNIIQGRAQCTTLETGASGSGSDYWNVAMVGGAGTIKMEFPGNYFTARGWSPQYPQSNGVLLTKDASGTTVGAAGAAAALPATPTAYWTVKDESGNTFKVPVYNP